MTITVTNTGFKTRKGNKAEAEGIGMSKWNGTEEE